MGRARLHRTRAREMMKKRGERIELSCVVKSHAGVFRVATDEKVYVLFLEASDLRTTSTPLLIRTPD